jgi:hypothetical protein
MILPTKHIPQKEALIGVGATLLRHMDDPRTVSALWDLVRHEKNVGTFERFVLAADLLYLLGAIQVVEGLLVRVQT